MATAAQIVATAAKEIGTMEGRDANGNWNNDNKYGKAYGSNKVAWCAIFVWWVFTQNSAANLLHGKTAWTPSLLQWFRTARQTGYYPPAPGDIILFLRNDGTAYHVGIVEKYLGNNRVQTIEGNTNSSGSPQGNGVYRLIRQDSPTNKNIVYCRPAYSKAPPVPPSALSTAKTKMNAADSAVNAAVAALNGSTIPTAKAKASAAVTALNAANAAVQALK